MIENGVTEDPSLERFRATFSSRRACERLFSSLLQIAENSDNKTENEAYMRELGGRHAAYMVNRQVLESFENPFLLACERFLKTEDKWHDTNKGHLKYFYSMIVDNISAGMDTGKNSGENKRAPTGSEPFCLLFTDIESSTNLWQRFPNIMREAVEQHHRIIRGIIHEYGGYEVKTAGDSFIIAARDVLVGLKIAVGIQLELMRHLPIVEGFEMLEEVQGGGDPEAWSNQTFRVRIGIEHCTQATATYDTIHRRYDYYGPSVNQCARIEAAAAGGQILMSRETFKALKAIPAFHDEPCPADLRDIAGNSPVDERGFDHFVAMCDVGKVKLKGIRKEVHVASVVPMCLAGRAFKIWSSNIDL
ncbi:Adenylate and Guanylate cyclase catalytic domain containing protein, putative [Angomonas deanei]|uniref:Adenylate and Guanylate cyclase catalytic domain containing protein, putative n=1 Tax=Angomonas deanei TaxID=59799 RepID=A0A7G2CRU4_9TRYP|nr:Adenylate and Guanylate cyclase catalytic domain containing protein, putative [Angomonas deanei]